jgi:hypothetical protein
MRVLSRAAVTVHLRSERKKKNGYNENMPCNLFALFCCLIVVKVVVSCVFVALQKGKWGLSGWFLGPKPSFFFLLAFSPPRSALPPWLHECVHLPTASHLRGVIILLDVFVLRGSYFSWDMSPPRTIAVAS